MVNPVTVTFPQYWTPPSRSTILALRSVVMGMLVQVLCHCGYYDSELTLAVGSGFKGIEAEQEGIPACCEVCHEVVLAADSHSPECPRCGNRVALYSDFTMYSSDFPHGDPSGPEPVAVRLRYTGR